MAQGERIPVPVSRPLIKTPIIRHFVSGILYLASGIHFEQQRKYVTMTRIHITLLKAMTLFLIFTLFIAPHAQAATKTLALLPLAIYADPSKDYLRQGLKSMLSSRLAGEGLDLVGDEALQSLLTENDKKNGVTSQARAEELAGKLRADYAVFGSITALGTGYSLDLSVLELKKDGSKVTKVAEAMEEDQLIPVLANVAYNVRAIITGVDIRPQKRASRSAEPYEEKTPGGLFVPRTGQHRAFIPTGFIRMKMRVMAFDIGDLDGDGSNEYLVLGKNKLLVYQAEEESLALKATWKSSLGEVFIKVTVGDMDKNGKAEIYLISQYAEMARSTVLEWDGKFKRILDKRGHLLIVRGSPETKPMLLFRDSQLLNFLAGKIWIMSYEGPGKLVQKEFLKGFENAQFHTLALLDLDLDGRMDFIGLRNADLIEEDAAPLQVWSRDGKVLWKGDEDLGGTNNTIFLRQEGTPLYDPDQRMAFNSRVVVADVDKDGKNEILVIQAKNITTKIMEYRLYLKSRVLAYKREGQALVQAWSTRNVNYCFTDIRVVDETIYLAAHKGTALTPGKGTGAVLWFKD
ncbi:hypothetical protein ACFL9T_22495 [Thermodesulfobacteriota bacterium]